MIVTGSPESSAKTYERYFLSIYKKSKTLDNLLLYISKTGPAITIFLNVKKSQNREKEEKKKQTTIIKKKELRRRRWSKRLLSSQVRFSSGFYGLIKIQSTNFWAPS